jgi:hypothetical protein
MFSFNENFTSTVTFRSSKSNNEASIDGTLEHFEVWATLIEHERPSTGLEAENSLMLAISLKGEIDIFCL